VKAVIGVFSAPLLLPVALGSKTGLSVADLRALGPGNTWVLIRVGLAGSALR